MKFNRARIKGKNLKILISNPNQAKNQEFAEIDVREPRNKNKMKIKKKFFKNIKKKEIRTLI